MPYYVKFKGSCYVWENNKETVRNEIKNALNEKFNPDDDDDSNFPGLIIHNIYADLTEIKVKDFYCVVDPE